MSKQRTLKKSTLKKAKFTGEELEARAEQDRRTAIKCKNEEQEKALETIENNTITFLSGIAGSGKTFMAVAYAAREFMKGNCEKIILCRPAIEACGEKLGHLPGEIASKIQPYMVPLFEILEYRMGKSFVEAKMNKGEIEVIPLGYVRGLTFSHEGDRGLTIVIIDEGQNMLAPQALMALTRLGPRCKIIVAYDKIQSDLNGKNCIEKVATVLSEKIPGIAKYEFKTSVRHPMIEKIIEAFEEIK